jgi:DNA-binding GntR family transcriptional regulator
MWDTINLRILVECEALRLSIERGDDSWEATIVSSLHALTRQYERVGSLEGEGLWELENRHRSFHHQLLAACGSPRLMTLFGRLYIDTERYRIPILLRSSPLRGRDVQKEHTDIAEAALERNEARATRKLTEHYQRTARDIEEQLNDQSTMTSVRRTPLARPRGRSSKVA